MRGISKIGESSYKLECECNDNDHSVYIEFDYDKDFKTLSLMFCKDLYYSNESFWKRLKDAFNIIFRGTSITYDSELIIRNKEHLDSFIKILQENRSTIEGVDEIFKVERVRKDVRMPSKSYDTDAGFDLYLPDEVSLSPGETKLIDMGFILELKPGWEAQIRNRSGMITRYNVFMKLGIGTIDSLYRGHIMLPLINLGKDYIVFKKGDRVAQMVIKRVPYVKLEEGHINIDTKRGSGGFGSTGL